MTESASNFQTIKRYFHPYPPRISDRNYDKM